MPVRGRQALRQRDGQFRVEQGFVGLELLAPIPKLGPVMAGKDRGARRLRAGAGGRRDTDRLEPAGPEGLRTERVGSGRHGCTRDRRHRLAEIEGRAAAKRDEQLGSCLAGHGSRGVGLGHGRIALDVREHGHAESASPQAPRNVLDHAAGLKARIGAKQHMRPRPNEARRQPGKLRAGAGPDSDARHPRQLVSGHDDPRSRTTKGGTTRRFGASDQGGKLAFAATS